MVWPAKDPRIALEQLGSYFMGTSPLHAAAREISKRLGDAGIDYAIAGALCLNAHGVMRATEDFGKDRGAIIVTCDRDFDKLIQRNKLRFRSAGRISLRCSQALTLPSASKPASRCCADTAWK